MSKGHRSKVPKGCSSKEVCKKCGRLFHSISYIKGSKLVSTDECETCNSKPYQMGKGERPMTFKKSEAGRRGQGSQKVPKGHGVEGGFWGR